MMIKACFTILPIAMMINCHVSLSEPLLKEYWMGAYLNQSKVGWSSLGIYPAGSVPAALLVDLEKLGKPPGNDSLFLISEARMGVLAYNKRKTVAWRTAAWLKPDLSLAAFSFSLESDDSKTEFKGALNGNALEITLAAAADARSEKIPVSAGPVFLAESLSSHLAERLSRGLAIDGEYQVFEPHQVTISPWKISLEGMETITLEGTEKEAFRIRQQTGGFCPITWIDRQGTVLKEWAPLGEDVGYLSIFEPREKALDPEYIHPLISQAGPNDISPGEPDLMYSTSVQPGLDIRQPSLVRRMVIDLSNFTLEHPLPQGPFQKILPGASSASSDPNSGKNQKIRLEILRPPIPQSGIILSNTEPWRKFLVPEPLVESDHPEVKSLAHTLTRDATDTWHRALAIHQWMCQNILPEFRITMPSALEVLRSGKGDCNEQSALFAALCRAAGVPVKICTGLVYQRGAFFYHAWNEILLQASPELWHPIDPVLKQQSSDATHIKFGEGGVTEQTYITALIGKIRAQIQEIESDDPNQPAVPKLRQ